MADQIWLIELIGGPRDGERFAVVAWSHVRWRCGDGHAYELGMTGHGTPETFGRDEAGRWLVKAWHVGKVAVP